MKTKVFKSDDIRLPIRCFYFVMALLYNNYCQKSNLLGLPVLFVD